MYSDCDTGAEYLLFTYRSNCEKKATTAVERIETIEERIGKLIAPHLKDQESWQKSLDVLHSAKQD